MGTSGSTTILQETNEVAVDWRNEGVVTPVKDQGKCGSCWAFSTVACLESAHAIKTRELISMSEQQVVDCDTVSSGCYSGYQYAAFEYFEKTGDETETDYPYSSGDGKARPCNADTTVEQFFVDSYTNVPEKSVAQLKAAIAKTPVSVTVEADELVFMLYKSGILNDDRCFYNKKPNHAVTAVGYGSEGDVDYYIIKNSWGAKWGE